MLGLDPGAFPAFVAGMLLGLHVGPLTLEWRLSLILLPAIGLLSQTGLPGWASMGEDVPGLDGTQGGLPFLSGERERE